MARVPSGEGELAHSRINATADGDNTIVAAVAGQRVRVIGYVIVASAAGTCTFQGTDNVVVASFPLSSGGGVSYGGPTPAFETNTGSGLEVSTAGGQDVLGHLTYQLV